MSGQYNTGNYMATCYNCGAQLQAGQVFCTQCGADTRQQQPHPGQQQPPQQYQQPPQPYQQPYQQPQPTPEKKKMNKTVLLAIIIGLVVVAAGILIAVFLSGDKPSDMDFDDDFDFTIGGTQAPSEETQAPTDETQGDDNEPQAPTDETPDDDNETQPSETTAPPATGHPALIGVWSGRKVDEPVAGLPASYAQRAYDTDPDDAASLLALVEDICKDIDISNASYVYYEVFREDGTGYYLGIFISGYMYTTYNYHVEGDILFSTNMVTNSENLDPGWVFDDQSENAENPFRIVVSGGQERLYVLPDFPEDSEYYGISMDEYMNTPAAEHSFMIKVK